MYRSYDYISGLRERIYRSPFEIEEDIKEIKRKISETEERLNIRSLIMDIIAGDRTGRPEPLIRELESAIADAGEALQYMKELDEELSLLREELMDVRCVLARN